MTATTLNNIALLKISGADAETFLQGQLTNDVTLLDGNWHYSGYCSPKGRLLGLFALWRNTDDFYALISKSLQPAVQARLKMFVMRSKVEIEHMLGAYIVGLQVPSDSPEMANGQPLNLSASAATTELGSYTFVEECHILGMGGRLLVVDSTGNVLSQDLPSDTEQTWLASNISAGLPSLQAETAEMFVPQMLNLDLLNGVSFKKGCYTGQEIVARMHYLGKLKQRMFLCDVEGDASEQKPGAKVISIDGKNVGNLVTPVVNQQCLAVLRFEHSGSKLLFDGAIEGRGEGSGTAYIIKAKNQPYTLEAGTLEAGTLEAGT